MLKKPLIRLLVEFLILLAITSVLTGKFFFHNKNTVLFLVTYGIIITSVMWMTFIIAFSAYNDLYFLALKAEKKNRKRKKNYMLSCMVAVKNEEKNISRCIDSMLRQSYVNKEVIVVNDGSTDGTLKILKEYEMDGKIILINLEKNVGKKRALGKAMLIARGDIFAHTDSDSVWAVDAMEKIVKIFEYNKDVGAVSGHGRALNGDQNLLTKIQDSWYEGQFSIRKAFESVFGAVSCVSGPMAVFRKEAIYNFIPAWENDRFLGSEFKFATDRTLTGFVLGSKLIGGGGN